MRRFRLLAAAAVAVLAILGFAASPAGAAGGAEVCEHAIEDAGDRLEASDSLTQEQIQTELDAAVKRCSQAPNPLLPELNEIIWGVIGFAVVFGFLYWKGLPAMKASMNARTERIRNDLESAESQRVEADELLANYRAQLADAQSEGARIIEESRQTADALKRDLQAQAESDVAELRARSVADIEAAKAQAIADLRNEVASIAIGAAERVVERNLDADTNTALVESFINQVGAGSQ